MKWSIFSSGTFSLGGGGGFGAQINALSCLVKKCSMEVQVAVMVILCITAEGFEDKYLGLPVPQGRMKAGKFQSTKDKALKILLD